MMHIFNTTVANKKYLRTQMVEMLQKEESNGYVQITRNDDFVLSNGAPVDVINAKIAKGKRGLNFQLHYDGFLLKSKTMSLIDGDYLIMGEQSIDLKRINFKKDNWADCISFGVDY